MFLVVLVCGLVVSSTKADWLDIDALKFQSLVDTRSECKGELGNPIIGNVLRHRRRLTVCYCDRQQYQNDPAGCQMVCDTVTANSSSSINCDCVEDLETCRQWLCRLGHEQKSGLYCRNVNQSVVPCRYAGQSNPTDFDECQCGNNGWRNNAGLCHCPANVFGPTCEHEIGDFAKSRSGRGYNSEKLRKWQAWTTNEIQKGNFISREDINKALEEINPFNIKPPSSSWSGSSWSGSSWSGSTWSSSSWTSHTPKQTESNWFVKNGLTVGMVFGTFGLITMVIGCYLFVACCRRRAGYRRNGRAYSVGNDSAARAQTADEPMLGLRESIDETTTGNRFGIETTALAYRVPEADWITDTGNSLPTAPIAEETFSDEVHSDRPPLYSQAVTVIAPSPQQSDEAPPSYEDVVLQKAAPTASQETM